MFPVKREFRRRPWESDLSSQSRPLKSDAIPKTDSAALSPHYISYVDSFSRHSLWSKLPCDNNQKFLLSALNDSITENVSSSATNNFIWYEIYFIKFVN